MRFVRPTAAVFAVALLASLCLHLPVYEVLGVLAEHLRAMPSHVEHAFVELELAPLSDAEEAERESDATAPAADSLTAEKPKPKPEPPRPLPEPDVAPRPDEAEPRLELKPKEQMALDLVPQEMPTKHAVTQKSDDPEVEPPPDARFVADENRRVQEEMVATARNEHRDDTPEPGHGHELGPPEEEGNAAETDVADLQNVDGEDERTPDTTEAEHRPVAASEPSAGSRDAKAVTTPAVPMPRPSERIEREIASGASRTGGEPTEVVVDDGMGRFTIREVPAGAGPGDQGGEEQPGLPTPDRQSRAGARAREGVNLDLSWTQFEEAFGAEQLRAERQAYLDQRRSKSSGRSRQQSWRKFRAAIENHVPYVRPGNQTALNAAASPFASYLATIHRRIHREFVYEFLRNLPIAGGPFDDESLHTKLEIVINPNGSLHHVGVAKSSGFLPFDYGAFNSVTDAAPYPAPPRSILSGDGRVYVHWGFYRNARMCGTFNATPFILPTPPGTPHPDEGPLHDEGPHDDAAPDDGEALPSDAEYGRLGEAPGGAEHGRPGESPSGAGHARLAAR